MDEFLSNSENDMNFFQLACAISVAVGLPAMIIGEQLAEKYGIGVALCSVAVGNLILWLIGMAMISMAYQDRTNAVENAKNYVGKIGGFFVALVLMFAFLNWFVLIINYSVTILSNLLRLDQYWQREAFVRFGAGLGLLTALLSIGNIKLIKWVTTFGLPVVITYHIYAIFSSEHSKILNIETWGLSSAGIISSALMIFPGMINLPTVFRHSRSRIDSYLGLSLMMCLITIFEASFIWMPFSSNWQVSYLGSYFAVFSVITTLFVLFKLICTNLLNIYFASACWELFFPHFEGSKGHAIIGLLGTAAYTFIQISSPIDFIKDLTNCYLTSLGVVLLIAFLVQIIVRHRPRIFEKSINGASWLVGCLASTISLVQNPSEGVQSLWTGIYASTLFFLCVIFIEETVWSIKKLFVEKNG